jgi:hypothetical protein
VCPRSSPSPYAESAGKAVLARPQEASRRSIRICYLANRKAVDGICCSRELRLAELLEVVRIWRRNPRGNATAFGEFTVGTLEWNEHQLPRLTWLVNGDGARELKTKRPGDEADEAQ